MQYCKIEQFSQYCSGGLSQVAKALCHQTEQASQVHCRGWARDLRYCIRGSWLTGKPVNTLLISMLLVQGMSHRC